jgi:hypothetical protein
MAKSFPEKRAEEPGTCGVDPSVDRIVASIKLLKSADLSQIY